MLKQVIWIQWFCSPWYQYPQENKQPLFLLPPPNLLADPSLIGHFPLDMSKLPKGLVRQPMDKLDED